MKNYICYAIMLAECLGQTPANSFLRQTNYGPNGGTADQVITNREGLNSSPLNIPIEGARLDLYAQGVGDDQNIYHLDSKIVGAYMHDANIEIISLDPHPKTRTRVDIPFTLNVSYERNINYPGDAVSSEEIDNFRAHFQHEGENFSTSSPNTQQNPYTIGQYDMVEGVTSAERYSALAFENITESYGEETFAIKNIASEAIPDEAILDFAKIKILPLASITFSGIEDGKRYISSLPDLRIDLKNLYPKSHTYVQIYPGKPVSAMLGTIIPNVYISYSDPLITTPQNSTLILNDWDAISSENVTITGETYSLENGQYILEDRVYTLEVLTVTPFNNGAPELLGSITFEVDKKVTVRGSITTSEK